MNLARLFAAFFLVLELAAPISISAATTCVDLPPVKPVRRISGVVFTSTGDRMLGSSITVTQAGKEVAMQQTDNDGKFAFDHLAAGKYEIRVQSPLTKRVAVAEVVLENPQPRTKKEIAVHVSVEGCHSFQLVNSSKFEKSLNSARHD